MLRSRDLLIALIVVAVGLQVAWAQMDCTLSPDFCTRLKPGMVVFVGREVAKEEHKDPNDRHMIFGSDTVVTFSVEEPLWGLDGATKSVRVHFFDGYGSSNEPKFLAASPGRNGDYIVNDCGAGLKLPVNDRWAQEFRKYVKDLTAADLHLRVVSSHGFVGLAGVRVEIRRNDKIFKGNTDRSGEVIFSKVEPGTYSLEASSPGYSL